jgi:hypothetical protein
VSGYAELDPSIFSVTCDRCGAMAGDFNERRGWTVLEGSDDEGEFLVEILCPKCGAEWE